MCLRSLIDQKTNRRFEIIVVDSSTDGTSELVRKKFPGIKLLTFADRKFPGDARNVAISCAKGTVVAFIDADCVARNNWIEEISTAHELPFWGIGGAIANGGPKNLCGWAAYFVEFSHWMPESPVRQMDDIAAANMSYKKQIFDICGQFIEGTYCSDSDFHWRMKRKGYPLLFEPSISILHRSIDRAAPFLKHEFFHGGCFARVRVRGQGFNALKRSCYAILAPFVALKVFVKIVQNNLRNKVYFSRFLKAASLVALGVLSWSAGEAVGYVQGPSIKLG